MGLFKLYYCICRYEVSGYPTLKFFPKSNKAGEEYDAGRELDDFVNFINDKSGTNRDGKGQLTSNVLPDNLTNDSKIIFS